MSAPTPISEPWRAVLDAVASAHSLTRSDEESRLADQLRALSEAYNAGVKPEQQRRLLAPRLQFSLPRDLQKTVGALRELDAAGRLAGDGAVLRVLDLGAGMGAATLGLAKRLADRNWRGTIEATWLDLDAPALHIGRAVAAQLVAAQLIPSLDIKILSQSLDELPPRAQKFDLIFASQVIRELQPTATDDERLATVVPRVRAWLDRLTPTGSLVIVEPALRDATRFLHRVRDAITSFATVFAPCVHQAPCPALALPSEWCHDDLAINLPRWLHPIARAAGLRWEGLTFSYLVLRTDGKSMRDDFPDAGFRIVSDALPSKGKCERFVCGRFADGVETRHRLALLRRDRDAHNRVYEDAPRGAVIAVEPPPTSDASRIGDAVVRARVRIVVD